MSIWWSGLDTLTRVFAIIASVATLFLIIQTIMLLIGIGHDSDVDADTSGIGDGPDFDVDSPDFDLQVGEIDFDADSGGFDIHDVDLSSHTDGHDGHVSGGYDPGLRIFTVRGFVAFFAVGGWVGVALLENGVNQVFSVVVALLAGLLFMVLLAWIFKKSLGLQYNGTMDIRHAVGREGSVYLTIPPAGEGQGKVVLVLQEALREFDAVTKEGKAIRTGSAVRVVSTLGTSLCVEPIREAKEPEQK